jgi:hypothetical protein
MPNNSRKGTAREYAVIDSFVDSGFWFIKANRSGQVIAERRAAARIPGDVFVWHPHYGGFQIEVGGAGKRLAREFEELRARLLIGFRPLVVMFTKGAGKKMQRRYYTSPDDRFDTITAMLERTQTA